ncbi:magnesium chelatase domain-containing protein, partial [Escherichia coli]
LAATGQAPAKRLSRIALLGELSLQGEVRACASALAAAHAAAAGGMQALIAAPDAAACAAGAPVDVIAAGSLTAA